MTYSLLAFADVLKGIGSVVLAILILLAMITVHEFGHYIVGKLFKFKINEFAIGFGPAIFKRKNEKTGEIFSVRIFPLGGYCAFAGEEGETENKEDNTLFSNKPPYQRILVLIAGAFMNILLAILCIFTLFFAFGQYEYKVTGVPKSEDISVPVAYTLKEEDIIIGIEDKNVYMITDYISILNGKTQGDIVEFTVIRGGEIIDIEVMLQADANFKNFTDTSSLLNSMGVTQMSGVPVKFGFWSMAGRSFAYSYKIAESVFITVGELFTGGLGLDAVGGPITTITMTAKIASSSFQSFLEITALIGVNLGVFNLLPIPALDGSKVIITAIEWVRGKPMNRNVEAAINLIGFILLFGFAILVDILQFI